MTDVTLGLESLESLLDQVRQARLDVATIRANGTAERYPEVALGDIRPLDNASLIREALRRELAHQQQVLRDIRRD